MLETADCIIKMHTVTRLIDKDGGVGDADIFGVTSGASFHSLAF